MENENDERAMFGQHLRSFFKRSHKELLTIAYWRYYRTTESGNRVNQLPGVEFRTKGEEYARELINVFATLEAYKVQYILIGGFAVNLHGFSRYTPNVDFWINETAPNRDELNKCLTTCGINIHSPQLPNGLPVRIFTRLTGLEYQSFESGLKRAVKAMIAETTLPILAMDQLIINKKAMQRQIDQLDVAALEEIQLLNQDN